MDAIAQNHHAQAVLHKLVGEIRDGMARAGAHAARTVVLMPYAQLMPVMRAAWAAQVPDGFVPRIETTMNWAGAAGDFTPGEDDLAFDMGRDLLTARALLERAGRGAQGELLAGRLVEAAYQLAGVAAAVPPPDRVQWAAQARAALGGSLEAGLLELEAVTARVALAWAAASGYATDALFAPAVGESVEALVVLEGFQREPLAEALKSWFGPKAWSLSLAVPAPPGDVRLYPSRGPDEEAERAAACVLRHVREGRVPVALAATDRVLTRRVRAMLGAQALAIRDETGWKLSTTRAAARVMAGLRACVRDAGSDAVLDWLKNSPALDERLVLGLERRARRSGVREWRSLTSAALEPVADLVALLERVNGWRDGLQDARPLPQWLAALRGLLQAVGQWRQLNGDAAGEALIAALRLEPGAQAEFEGLPQAARRWRLGEFTAWVNDALEAASFVPGHPQDEQVVILPFAQVLGRPFPALVLPGCDEVRLNPAAEPPGAWTTAQREGLGLPSRASLEAGLRAGWRYALQTPHADVLWRQGDENGEPLLPSPLVQALQLHGTAHVGAEPREARPVAPVATQRPHPVGAALPVAQLSASAYDDLRRCPYRFFAMRQLGLQEVDELDAELDKRDFGNWLHAVLSAFHESLRATGEPAGEGRRRLIDIAADEVTREMGLEEGEFLPFAAAWPQVRDGYLHWLAGHEADGATFEEAESRHEMPLGPVQLVGRIDRIDRLPDGTRLVMDYKTEAVGTTRERIKRPMEDTQLAFYAALLADDSPRAAYVNVGERDGTRLVPQDEVVAVRDALVEGILHDLRRVEEGKALPALGEGVACEFCSARGLCRRDFW